MAAAKPLTGVGFNGFSRSYNAYDKSHDFGEDRSVHSVWFGLVSELGYPGLALFVVILLMAMWSCQRVAKITRGNPLQSDLAAYAWALTTSFFVFAAGGTFLPAQYNEMFWHFVGIAIALHSITLLEHDTATVIVEAPTTAIGLAWPARA